MAEAHVVIPARFASTRLPGKPLADIAGLPMIVRTAASAAAAEPTSVVVATDDARVFDVVRAAGYEAEMTSTEHPTGTDRVLEVVDKRGWSDDARVLNVQGDEPLVPAAVLRQLSDAMADGALSVATLCEPIERSEDVFNPNIVKVVRDVRDRAIYFSRAPIPFDREAFDVGTLQPGSTFRSRRYFRHVGIYGYTVSALRQFVALPASDLEETEALEQLRLLEAGVAISVFEACAPIPGGVDTPEDLARVTAVMEAAASR